jgi:hypothetical protein
MYAERSPGDADVYYAEARRHLYGRDGFASPSQWLCRNLFSSWHPCATRFGLLATNTVNGNVPRDIGTMPEPLHLDMNLSRIFTLNPNDKDHPRTFTFNARSANLLNHTNVTAVNSVLSSSAVGEPIAAEAARRVEFGVRFAFWAPTTSPSF